MTHLTDKTCISKHRVLRFRERRSGLNLILPT